MASLIFASLCTEADERKQTLPVLYICTHSVSGATLRWPDHLVERARFVSHENLLYNDQAEVPSTLNATGDLL